MSAAWFCPACQRHHAPFVETCPVGGGPSLFPAPIPFHPKPSFAANLCPKCGMSFDGPMGYVCPNSDCPTQARSSCTTTVIMSGTQNASGIAS